MPSQNIHKTTYSIRLVIIFPKHWFDCWCSRVYFLPKLWIQQREKVSETDTHFGNKWFIRHLLPPSGFYLWTRPRSLVRRVVSVYDPVSSNKTCLNSNFARKRRQIFKLTVGAVSNTILVNMLYSGDSKNWMTCKPPFETISRDKNQETKKEE